MLAPDLEPILDALYALPPWWLGAAIVLPDWPEGDLRWKLLDELGKIHTAGRALDRLRDAIDCDERMIARRYIEAGMTRPQIASALGVTLSQLREWMGWP